MDYFPLKYHYYESRDKRALTPENLPPILTYHTSQLFVTAAGCVVFFPLCSVISVSFTIQLPAYDLRPGIYVT